MWIYEAPDWPALRWDAAALAGPCAAVHRQQEHLRAHMQACSHGVQARFRLALLTEEITASAAIEGEHFDKHCVRACLEERLPWLAAAGQEQTAAHATLQSSLSATGSRPVGADRSGRAGRADRRKPCQGMVDMVCEALLLPREPFPDAAPARACARCTGTEPAPAPTPDAGTDAAPHADNSPSVFLAGCTLCRQATHAHPHRSPAHTGQWPHVRGLRSCREGEGTL